MEKVIKPNNKVKNTIISIICIVVISLSLTATAIFAFQHFYYSPFWVSGQSMYPTLNKEAKYADGTLVGEMHTAFFSEGEYDIDYGFMVTTKGAIKRIKRFDIIIFEVTKDSEIYNIKRVIALPGETFYIKSSNDETNGDLYILNETTKEYELTTQPIDKEIIASGTYPLLYQTPTKLADDEYFVMGDNRIGNNSYDSRERGPIKKEIVYGVAKALNGKATLGYNKKGKFTAVKVKRYWPRFF